jgi:AmmeMemoRadiSam system protein B/AmmeMemoRadiSam system protein A
MIPFRLFCSIFGLCLLISLNSSAQIKRTPAVAGTFYPADKAELENIVKTHLDNVSDLPEIDGQIIALIVPHAGLVYSGQIAAHAYKLLDNSDFNTVILCGPSHRYRLNGIAVESPDVVWTNPIGDVTCDKNLALQLTNFSDRINNNGDAHRQEHSLEVQLPYLQMILDDFKIVPLVMGSQDAGTINLLADALKAIETDRKAVMVASTDLQHYRSAEAGWDLDSLTVDCIANLDPVRLERMLNGGRIEMCGGGPTAAVMKAAIARGADKVKILKYAHSGDVSGDNSQVVGYVAAVLYKSEEKASPEKSQNENLPEKFKLSAVEKEDLLRIARRSIEGYLNEGKIPEFEVSDNLKKFGAGFVTLKKDGQLRGCIGYTTATGPLHKTISECAVKAAVSDYRFPPVTAGETKALHIEISVLTPMQEIASFDEIEIGRDGLMIFRGSNRGLLLPQVAVEQKWNRTQFLEATSRKAGLAPDAYRSPDAVVYKFQAVIFEED